MCATVGSRNEGSQAKIIYALRYLWDGWYVVQRIPKRLNVVAMDQVLQQTINKDEESKLGVIGLTVKNQHWLDGSRQGVLLQIMLNHIGHCRRTPSKIRTQRIGEGMKKFMVKCLKGDGFWKHLPKSTWSRESTNRTPWFCHWQIRLRWCMQKKKKGEREKFPSCQLYHNTKGFWDPESILKLATLAAMRKTTYQWMSSSMSCQQCHHYFFMVTSVKPADCTSLIDKVTLMRLLWKCFLDTPL